MSRPLGGLAKIGMMIEGRRPKVAHLTSVHSTTDTRIVHKECATLAHEGYEVVLIAPGPQSTLPGNVRHRPVALPRNRFERFTQTVPSVYRAAAQERADVYHFHDPELIFAGALLRARGAQVIFDVHEDVPADIQTKPWIPSLLRPVASRIAALILRCLERCFTAIVSATPSIARTFTHHKAVIVRNYPIRDEFQSDVEPIPYHERPTTALYLGSITALRGAQQMIRAMENPVLPPQARLVMAGPFEDEALRAECAALGAWSRVDYRGTLPRQSLPAILGSARMGLLVFQPAPNHDNAMPTKFFEYLGAGLPVITSRFLVAFQEIIERYGCGILVDPRDSDDIARAMTYLFEHPEEAAAMGQRGRQVVAEGYEWSSEARALVGLYRELAS